MPPTPSPQNVREDENVNHEGLSILFWVFSCPWSQNTFFKNGCSTQFKFLPILFPFPCNNYLNQILAEINDWGERQEMGSWQFWWVFLWHMDFPQIRISFPILFPFLCNNYFNQFLAVTNDWVNETRKVVDCLMGSPFEIWIFPIGPKV